VLNIRVYRKRVSGGGGGDLHYSIYMKLGFKTAQNWSSLIPKAMCEH